MGGDKPAQTAPCCNGFLCSPLGLTNLPPPTLARDLDKTGQAGAERIQDDILWPRACGQQGLEVGWRPGQ